MNEQTNVILGKVKITPKGEYNSETQYAFLDVVSENGSSYLAKKPSINVPVTSTEYWQLIAQKGEPGTAAGFGEPTAEVEQLEPGEEPTVEVTSSGTDVAKIFHFQFGIPKGAQGDTGNGIASIEKTGTVGKVDTYTITYTDETTETFTVTNGTDGAAAGFGTPDIDVDSGTGTPYAEIETSGPDTAKVFKLKFHNLKGAKGDKGDDGASDAGEVTYDPSETYASGTVGAALTEQSSRIAQLDSTKASKAALAETDYKATSALKWLEGIAYDVETDDDEAYSKTIKSGVVAPANKATVQMFGGKSRTTKNLAELEQGTLDIESGIELDSTTRIRTKFMPVSVGNYIVSGDAGLVTKNGVAYDASKNYIGYGYMPTDDHKFVVSNQNVKYVRFVYGNTDNTQILPSDAPLYQFESGLEPTPYEPYFDGIKSADCDAVVSQGANIFDGEWENGYWDTATGQKASGGNWRRCTDYIPINPNTRYYRNIGGTVTGSFGFILFYDVNKQLISYTESTSFTTPQNAYYLTFYAASSFVAAGLCVSPINQYSQYVEYSMSIPDRLREEKPLLSAPNVADDYNLDTMKGHQRVGTRAHQEGDEDDATVITDGTTTQYPLATPVEYDLAPYFDENFSHYIDVESGGTVTFHQSDSEFTVPNSISYMRKLSEVAS